jgi:hypothetical protein
MVISVARLSLSTFVEIGVRSMMLTAVRVLEVDSLVHNIRDSMFTRQANSNISHVLRLLDNRARLLRVVSHGNRVGELSWDRFLDSFLLAFDVGLSVAHEQLFSFFV